MMSDMALQGIHRIDKLDADTMYRITILKRYEQSDNYSAGAGAGEETASVASNASNDHVVVLVGVENATSSNEDVEDTDLSLGTRTRGGEAEDKNIEISFEVFDDEIEKDPEGISNKEYQNALDIGDGLGHSMNCVKDNKYEKDPSEPTSHSLFVSTYADPIFLFDHEKLVLPNLVLSSTLLTVKNGSNKKWSTVRGSVKMTTGIYRWDIHIDK